MIFAMVYFVAFLLAFIGYFVPEPPRFKMYVVSLCITTLALTLQSVGYVR